jgi:hypothetical protein
MKPWKKNNPTSTEDIWPEPYRKTVADILKEAEEEKNERVNNEAGRVEKTHQD